MNRILNALETLGRDPDLWQIDATSLGERLQKMGLNEDEFNAMILGDAQSLADMLGAREQMCAVVFPVEDGDDDSGDDQGDGDDHDDSHDDDDNGDGDGND